MKSVNPIYHFQIPDQVFGVWQLQELNNTPQFLEIQSVQSLVRCHLIAQRTSYQPPKAIAPRVSEALMSRELLLA